MKKIYDDDDSPKWKRVFGVDKRERSINRDVIVQYLLRIFIPYQFTCYLQIFLPHIPLLCLHISLSTPINPSSTDFITLVRDVPSSIGPHTHTHSLFLYFNLPFNYELHQSRISLFSPSRSSIRSSLYRATKSSTSSVYQQHSAFESGDVYSSSRISSSSTW